MARGTQFTQLVIMLREEISRSASLAVGVSDLPELKQKITRVQETLYDEYDWPFLRQIFDLQVLQSSERYYDFPPALNLERVEKLVVWYSNLPLPLERGINFSDYAAFNPAAGVTSSPVRKWDVRWTGTKEQIEVWPLPPDNTQSIQFQGIRKLRSMVFDSDVADLDDQLIVLTAAAELLIRQGDASAAIVAKRAEKRAITVRGRVQGASRMRAMGQGTPSNGDARLPIVVHAR